MHNANWLDVGSRNHDVAFRLVGCGMRDLQVSFDRLFFFFSFFFLLVLVL